jgi:predicted RND superfamily exporter protein
LDSSRLMALRKIEAYLVDSYGVGSLVSPLQPLRLIHQIKQGGAEAAFALPQNSETERAVVDSVRMLSEEMNKFILSSDERVGRFSGRVGDLGSAVFQEKNKVFQDFLDREIEPMGIKASLTGISEIIDSNNEYLTDNLMEGLIYELLAIALLMGLLFRNWRITLVSIIPNVFPLLFIGACMGWFGVHLNLSSAIIFNIAFGITVDDTIHLLAGYKLELGKGKKGREALRAAYLHSGKAVFMTSIILCSGFFVLMLSQFNGIYHTGLLVGITLVVALISDLVLLPILLGGKGEEADADQAVVDES